MRTRLAAITVLVGLGLIGSVVAGPAVAADKEVEGTLVHPAPTTGPALYGDSLAEHICAGDVPPEGTNYAWIDLEGEFKKFTLAGPPHNVSASDAGGVMGDHDLDWFLYDAKCKSVTTHSNGPESGMKTEARRPAQFVLVQYWFGVYPNLPYKLVATN